MLLQTYHTVQMAFGDASVGFQNSTTTSDLRSVMTWRAPPLSIAPQYIE